MDPIRIFVGTDRYQQEGGAELVLEHTIRKFSKRQDIEITWMRSGEGQFAVSKDGDPGTWAVGSAVDAGWVDTQSWGTPFTGFRFAVPELCNFEGKAIYLDADMLVLGDIDDLWNQDIAAGNGVKCWGYQRTDVSVWDCSWFKNRNSGHAMWPSIEQMMPSKARCMDYVHRLNQMGAVDPTLDRLWNDCDGSSYDRGDNVQLLHYTYADGGQPWRPYLNITYPSEYPYVNTAYLKNSAAVLWWDTYREALIEKHGESEGTRVWEEAKS